ncbi:hypothetical protein B0H19DRAFT_1187973 [Mycena capillaripes]|nr:hypothetical protein B0H19DRAFT_1187973 [Mycena capillaripes]
MSSVLTWVLALGRVHGVDTTFNHSSVLSSWPLELLPFESGISFSQVPEDSHIMASILLQDYHYICYFHLAWEQAFLISTNDSVQLGSIRHFPGSEYKNLFEIAFASDVVVDDRGW